MRIKLLIALLSVPGFAASWNDATAKLTPGARVVVEHKGKIDRGLYALSNANEIIITTNRNGQLIIPQAEVDRLMVKGTKSPQATSFANARDQLLPKQEVIVERPGAPVPIKGGKKDR